MKIAEEVAKRVPAVAQYGSEGKPTGVYYEQLSVLLLAQTRRQHTQLNRQGAALERQQREIDWLKREVKRRR